MTWLLKVALIFVTQQRAVPNRLLNERLDSQEVMNRNVDQRHLRLYQHVSKISPIRQENIISVTQRGRVHAKGP